MSILIGCEKVTRSDPGEGARVWHVPTRSYVTLGTAVVRMATWSNGNTDRVHMESCQTHEARVKEARENMIKAIEAYSQLAGAQENTTTKE